MRLNHCGVSPWVAFFWHPETLIPAFWATTLGFLLGTGTWMLRCAGIIVGGQEIALNRRFDGVIWFSHSFFMAVFKMLSCVNIPRWWSLRYDAKTLKEQLKVTEEWRPLMENITLFPSHLSVCLSLSFLFPPSLFPAFFLCVQVCAYYGMPVEGRNQPGELVLTFCLVWGRVYICLYQVHEFLGLLLLSPNNLTPQDDRCTCYCVLGEI